MLEKIPEACRPYKPTLTPTNFADAIRGILRALGKPIFYSSIRDLVDGSSLAMPAFRKDRLVFDRGLGLRKIFGDRISEEESLKKWEHSESSYPLVFRPSLTGSELVCEIKEARKAAMLEILGDVERRLPSGFDAVSGNWCMVGLAGNFFRETVCPSAQQLNVVTVHMDLTWRVVKLRGESEEAA